MKIVEPGHVYELTCLDGEMTQLLTFVAREPENGREHPGTQNQEVLRALIDRVQHCQARLSSPLNEQILYHLRMALSLHEARAIVRKTEKGYIQPEQFRTGGDGHWRMET